LFCVKEAPVQGTSVGLTEAARTLGVSEQTVRNWADRGVLPAWRHPTRNARMFEAQDVQALRERLSGQAEEKAS
jgi:excisionase family DNA binding protein